MRSFARDGKVVHAQVCHCPKILSQISSRARTRVLRDPYFSQGIIMQIRKQTVLSLIVLGLALAPFSFGQFAKQPQTPVRVRGYYDPATGTFSPAHQSSAETDATTTATTEAGELIVKYTITVKSAIPKNGVVGCSASAETGDAAGDYEERASGVATLVSGTTYTCSAIMHYSWKLDTPTTDKISITGSSTIDYGYQVTATNGTAILVQPIEDRGSDASIPSINVPANGATTTVDVSVTL